MTVRITENALNVDIDDTGGGNLTIQEVAGGTTAAALGIVNESGTATNPINGTDLDPILTKTTLLDDILGVRASALVTSIGNDDDIIVEAVQNGTALNGTVVQFVDDNALRAAGGLSVGNETVSYSTTAVAARAALTLSGVSNDLVFTARTAGTAANNINIVLDATNNIGDAAVVTFNGTSTVTIQIDDTDETTLQTLVDAVNNQVGGLFNVAADNSAGEAFDGGSLVSAANAGFASGNTSNSGAAAGTLLINIDIGDTTADNVVAAINNDVTVSQLFEARVDGKDTVLPVRKGTGDISVNATATLAGGSGSQFDRQSGIQIINDGTLHNISFTTAVTVEDMLNILNGSDAGVLAEINTDGTGINIRSRLSGADFHIGENGGSTATQLGLRSFDQDTVLSNLNHGIGIHTTEGTDFTIQRNDGVELEIDLSNAQTVGDVLDLINNDPDNLDPSTALVARLKATGNGIELVDDNPLGVGTLTLIADPLSKAAQDLGLLPFGLQQTSPSDGAPPVAAIATAAFPAPDDVNTGMVFTATQAGTTFNGVNVIITSGTATGDQALVTYDPNAKTLSIDVDPLATTAQTVVNVVTAEGAFSASLDLSTDLTNNGTGLINQLGSAAISAGGTSNPASLPASAPVQLAPPNQTNTSMIVTASEPGTSLNGVDIVFQDTQTGDVAVAVYNGVTKQLVVNIDTAATTANTVIQAIIAEGTFNASLDNSVDVTNDGSGIIAVAGTVGTTQGGTPEILAGNDVNPLEVSGIFNSITCLNDALVVNDLVQIQRAVELLDEDLERLGFARGELGAQQRAMDILEFRLEEENIQLQSSLSLEIDIDLAEAITEMTARQTTLEASMRSMGISFQLTLLDFL